MWDDSENTGKAYGAGRGRAPCTVKCRWWKGTRIWKRKGGGSMRKSRRRTEWRIREEQEWEDTQREQESERIIMVLPPTQYLTTGNWEEE
jgi:hypothetical protein